MLHGLKKPVVRVGRMAGQYAKPRSADTETRDGDRLPSFRGDLVNRAPFTEPTVPDPELIIARLRPGALTLNFVRALVDGGFADLHHPEYWDLDWVGHSAARREYHDVVESISNSLDFLESISGRAYIRRSALNLREHTRVCILSTSRRKRALRRDRWYNLTRTFPGSACARPIWTARMSSFSAALRTHWVSKIGRGMIASGCRNYCRSLNPNNEPGRIDADSSFRCQDIDERLPD